MENRIDLYNKTVDILYNAYFNDTLLHSYCAACAVGNIIAANCGFIVDKSDLGAPLWKDGKGKKHDEQWGMVFSTGVAQSFYSYKYRGIAKKQIDSSGYELEELMRIEYAFEKAPRGSSDEDWMFNGLVEVLNVLKNIHEIDDNKETVKKFTNRYNIRIGELVTVE